MFFQCLCGFCLQTLVSSHKHACEGQLETKLCLDVSVGVNVCVV